MSNYALFSAGHSTFEPSDVIVVPPDSDTQRYFTLAESLSGLSLTLAADERFEIDFMMSHTDDFQEILKGTNTAFKINKPFYSSAAITLATNGNSTKYFNTSLSYSHGCFNTLTIQMNSAGNGLELFMNGESLGTDTLGTASINIGNIGDNLRYIKKLAHFDPAGIEVLRYDFKETTGLISSPTVGTGDLTFSSEPKRFEFILTDGVWVAEPSGFPDAVKISIPEDAPVHRNNPVTKPTEISYMWGYGQSLGKNFLNGDNNEQRFTATVPGGYVLAGGGLAKFVCRRDIYSAGRLEIQTANEIGGKSYMYANTAVANTAIDNLDKGNSSYDNVLEVGGSFDSAVINTAPDTEITQFNMLFTHGEADASDVGGVTPVATYQAEFEQLKLDAKTDVIRATSNSNIDFRFVYTQLGRQGQSQDLMNWFYDFAVATNDPDYVYAGPRWWINASYFDALDTPAPDAVHLSPYGYALLAEMHGQAMADPNWQPLMHRSCISDIENNSQTVTIEFDVQTLPLRKFVDVDDDTLGIAYVNASGTKSEVNSVTISGDSLIVNVGQAVEAGSHLRFGGGSRTSEQPRVNLMDSTAFIGPDTGYEHNHIMSVSDIAINPVPIGNTAPAANAGTNQTLAANIQGQLSGSGTATTAGATITSYQWVAPAGITLSGANTANPTFTAPQLNAATTFTFSLVVTDSNGLTSVADTVDIIVEAYSPPVETDSSVLVLNVPTANGQYDVYLHTKEDGKEVVFDGVVTFNNGGATIQLDIDDGILLTGDATPVSNPTEFNSFGIWGVTQ